MSVSDLPPVTELAASGTTYSTAFEFNDKSEVVVLVSATADAAWTLLQQGVDYTLTGGSGSAGTVTLAQAPGVSGAVRIKRVVELTQPISLRTQGTFAGSVHEKALDRLTYQNQQIAQRLADLEGRFYQVGLPYTDAHPITQLAVTHTFTTHATVLASSFPFTIDLTGLLPALAAPAGVVLKRIRNLSAPGDLFDTAVWVDWAPNVVLTDLTIRNITGLAVNTQYQVTLELYL